MTHPTSGGVPAIPPGLPSNMDSAKKDALKDVVDKVSQATGIPAKKEATPATSITALTPSHSSPDVQKAAKAVKQWLDLETLLKMVAPVREVILKDLSHEELQALEIAISKGTAVQENYKTEFGILQKQIPQIKQNRILEEILVDHPVFRNIVKNCKGVSIEDKIWLLQILELSYLGIDVRISKELTSSTTDLKGVINAAKSTINAGLDKVIRLDVNLKNLKKCPRAICLLRNLEVLNLSRNHLTSPPDVSKNLKLRELNLAGNHLQTPPDISKNINLESLNLNTNKLNTIPNCSKNVNLKNLNLDHNPLSEQAIEALKTLQKENKKLHIQYGD